MAFDRQFLDELIARNDIVDVVSNYVSLQPRGGSLWGCCPFHSEKTPSFHVLPDKQLCYCFGCKEGGGVINFIMEEENLSFPDAVRFLARRANMPVPEEEHSDESRLRSRILSLNRDAARFYYEQLYSPKGAPVLEYMKNRKITRRNATNFGLGASADEWDGLLLSLIHIYFLRSTNFWYCSEIFFRIFSISRLPSSCVSRTRFFVPGGKTA